ncbi:MAG: DUF1549 domain-containing protein [Acidobacteria bacterium]|nr:DUF1549 domain-containing protein [Acidobacteriota bacterium]
MRRDGNLRELWTKAWLRPVAAVGLLPVFLPAQEVTFIRDVMPVLNKVGCTSGPCHGGAKGKAGFKLSLRGYDTEFDYRAILHDMAGRRYNRTEPENSLILLKPTMSIPHGGGLRLDPASTYYQTVLRWLRDGAPYGDPVSAQVTRLDVTPGDLFFEKPTAAAAMKVIAHYADGKQRDVSQDAQYSSTVPQVADVAGDGRVSTFRQGEAALLVRYEGKLSVINITVLSDKPGFAWQAPAEFNYIDKFIHAKLQRVRVQPSPLATDAEFLRRVSLDLAGLPPTPEELRAFVADKTETRRKRAAAIDRLMARPEFVNHWSVKWGDLLQVNRNKLGDKGMWAFRDWIRESLAANRPYDQMVRELVTAKGSTFQNPPANFFRFNKEAKVAMENMTQLFMGVRMVCAQCHDHPFEQWTQNQYFQMAAFFAGVGSKTGADAEEEVIFDKREDAHIMHPKDGRVMDAKFLFGGGKFSVREAELRESLAEWLTAKENPYFAKALVNRFWSYFMGRGIIDPVDDIRASNPPSNPALLEALTADFAAHNHDLRHLIKTIVNSRAYQLSFQPNEWNANDEINFSRAYARRLSAEQLYDAIYIAAGVKPRVATLPDDSKAQDFPDANVDKGGFLDLFGRPERQTSCECERRSDVSLVQALNLVNGSTIADAIADSEGRVAKLVLSGATDRKIVEELYQAALSRPPEPAEIDYAQTYLRKGSNRAERAQDLLWALLNSNAFLFNR